MSADGTPIPGWADASPSPDAADEASIVRSDTLRAIRERDLDGWESDAVRRELGKALARERTAWRQHGDDEEAIRGVTRLVAYAMRLWAGELRGDNAAKPIAELETMGSHQIAAGIVSTWKRPSYAGGMNQEDLL